MTETQRTRLRDVEVGSGMGFVRCAFHITETGPVVQMRFLDRAAVAQLVAALMLHSDAAFGESRPSRELGKPTSEEIGPAVRRGFIERGGSR